MRTQKTSLEVGSPPGPEMKASFVAGAGREVHDLGSMLRPGRPRDSPPGSRFPRHARMVTERPQLRILIVAENASARFGGEAILPLHIFRGLRRRGVEAWLVVHGRTQ